MGVCLRLVIGNEYPAVPLPNVGIAAQRNVTDSLAVNGVVRVAHLPRPRRPLRLTHQNDTPSRSPSLTGRKPHPPSRPRALACGPVSTAVRRAKTAPWPL